MKKVVFVGSGAIATALGDIIAEKKKMRQYCCP